MTLGFSETVATQQSYRDLVFPPLTFTPPQVERQTLPNGLQLFLVEDHELPVISMSALIKTGAMYEPADKLGLAAITAEVLRSGGTANRKPDEVNDTLEYLATSIEADIQEELGSVELWTLKENLATSLDILADLLRHPAFADDKVELAKAQMLEVIRRRNDYPEDIANREFLRLVYGNNHPLARIPEIETMNNVTREDVLAFYAAYFHPNNIMLAITGDFETADMVKQIETALGDWPSVVLTFPPVEVAKPALAPSVNLIQSDVDQANVMLGHLGITAKNPDYPAVYLLDLILGAGGFSSRLVQTVRNKLGLAYSVGSSLGAGLRDDGVFLVYCGTGNDTVGQAIQAIRDQLAQITQAAVSAEELQAAQNQYLNSFVFQFAAVADIVRRNMIYEYMGYPPDFLETFRDRVMQVTREDVLRVAHTYLHPDQLTILAVGKAEVIRPLLTAFGEVHDIRVTPVEATP
jgi:zinc protease